MVNLILRLRGMTETGSSDYTLGSVTYWTDNHLQDVLDLYRTDLERVPLRSAPEYVGGATVYYDYYTPEGSENFEESGTGVEAWAVRDGDGVLIATADYTVNYLNGHIRFDTDQAGQARYLRARFYDLSRAAAHVWRQKAAHVASKFDLSTDNHSLTRSQLIKHYLEMAGYYDRQAGPTHGTLVRSDLY
jgi:hypothetical protein